jgi:formamidopyrimidine-DNA glycosylase
VPELPDISLYLAQLRSRILGQPLERLIIRSPFVLRSVEPSPAALQGKQVTDIRRMGKRIVLTLEDDLYVVIHLMIAGRFRWKAPGAPVGGKLTLAAFEFPTGSLQLTEAGSKRRASIHLVAGVEGLRQFERGGLEVLDASVEEFRDRLISESHTVKRALTDPRLFSGIGNAYSDEILHRARLSPLTLTSRLTPDQISTLYQATRSTLQDWIERLTRDAGGDFPEKVTAFREGMAVHGRFGKPCPDCGAPVQRIRYADNETNYCARCQTGGRLLADRALSRLLKQDWPRSIDELD